MVYYLVNLVAVLINGGLVFGFFWVLNMGVPVVDVVREYLPMVPEKKVLLFLTVVVMGSFVGVGLSPLVDLVIRFVKGYRPLLRDEREFFEVAFLAAAEQAGADWRDYKVYAVDDSSFDSDHLGFDTMAFSRRILKRLKQAELKAIVTHEMAHLEMGHGVQVRVFFAVNLLGQLALWFTKQFLKMFENMYGLKLPFVEWFGMFGFGCFKMFGWMIEFFLVFPLVVGAIVGFRHNEYAADRFVVEMGFGEGLHSYLLDKLDTETKNPSTEWKVMRWAKGLVWPSTGKRLVEIERVL